MNESQRKTIGQSQFAGSQQRKMPPRQNEDEEEIESQSISSNGSGDVRLNLRAAEEPEEWTPDQHGADPNRRSKMDVEERTKSLTESDIDTEKADDQYDKDANYRQNRR